MKISLKNYNSGQDFNKHDLEFEVFVVVRDDEIIFVNEDAKEIASIKCSAMTNSEDMYANGYWLEFKSVDKNIGDANSAPSMLQS